ncbi:hypothetical protein AB0B45_13320 [Nonomuraea sp. NPDC049152]|uniref:hypothetical protein n=1 Tax=Nonomuraea sp. NPDC049152 TaxID=3154350 RepID=UPI0033DA5DCB
MRRTLLGAAAVVAVAAAGLPAIAHADSAGTARVAWVGSCDDKDEISHACGAWRVRLRSGGQIKVADAAATSVDAHGRKTEETGKFAISADGEWIVYERKSDHRLAVRRTSGGRVTLLPKSLTRLGTDIVRVWLSPSGDRVLLEYSETGEKEPGKIVTVATGKIVKLPAGDDLEGFSGDGDEALALRYNTDNTTTLVALGADGSTVAQVPPQVVINASTRALAADGRTVAVFAGAQPKLRLYDLSTDRLAAAVDLRLKKGTVVYHAQWTGEDQLTVKVQSGGDGKPTVVRVLTVDTGTGAVKPVDTFTVIARNYAWLTAGE